jgi:hypothetical protein
MDVLAKAELAGIPMQPEFVSQVADVLQDIRAFERVRIGSFCFGGVDRTKHRGRGAVS